MEQTVYVAFCMTGACCMGVYTTLEQAKFAVCERFALAGEQYDESQWSDTFGNDTQHTFPDSKNGGVTDIVITRHELDAPLPLV